MSGVWPSVADVITFIQGWGGWAAASVGALTLYKGLPPLINAVNAWAQRTVSSEQQMRIELRAALKLVNEAREELIEKAHKCEARCMTYGVALRQALFCIDLLVEEIEMLSPGNAVVARARHMLTHIFVGLPDEEHFRDELGPLFRRE